MKSSAKNLLVAGLIATFGLAASAQTPQGPGPGGPGYGHMMGRGGQGDPAAMKARMTERYNQRMNQLKTVLQIKPEQQGA